VLHIHQHLDVFDNGRRVTVPAGIGIGDTFISPLHTHDTSGVMHVESPTIRPFTLAEFFGVWGVPLAHAKVYVDGKRFDPRRQARAAPGDRCRLRPRPAPDPVELRLPVRALALLEQPAPHRLGDGRRRGRTRRASRRGAARAS
jgi:hypothetical protein